MRSEATFILHAGCRAYYETLTGDGPVPCIVEAVRRSPTGSVVVDVRLVDDGRIISGILARYVFPRECLVRKGRGYTVIPYTIIED